MENRKIKKKKKREKIVKIVIKIYMGWRVEIWKWKVEKKENYKSENKIGLVKYSEVVSIYLV